MKLVELLIKVAFITFYTVMVFGMIAFFVACFYNKGFQTAIDSIKGIFLW